MPFFDMPLAELQKYKPALSAKPDFNAFWEDTIRESANYPLNPGFEKIDFQLNTVDTFDVTFAGFMGQKVKGWLILPKGRSGKLPCVVEYIGYGGGRGYPTDWLFWSSAGYAHLIMDTRGQGSHWLRGDTADIEQEGSNPQYPGFLTRGVLSPETYYYRRLYVDAVRAVEAARSHTEVDVAKIAVTGMSQGGGLSIAVSGLVPDVALAMPDVPFLCDIRRATQITNSEPYSEIVHFCKIHRDKIDRVFDTLSYFDGINFAARSECRSYYSVALMDDICPPSTVFAAYNHHAGKKDIAVYEYNNHEGGASYHNLKKLEYAKKIFG